MMGYINIGSLLQIWKPCVVSGEYQTHRSRQGWQPSQQKNVSICVCERAITVIAEPQVGDEK